MQWRRGPPALPLLMLQRISRTFSPRTPGSRLLHCSVAVYFVRARPSQTLPRDDPWATLRAPPPSLLRSTQRGRRGGFRRIRDPGDLFGLWRRGRRWPRRDPAPPVRGDSGPAGAEHHRPSPRMKGMHVLVEATSISKTINERELWSDMNLSVGPGEIFGVLGQSGSGKTTLLTCLGGLAPIDGGEIRIGDVRLDNASRVQDASCFDRTSAFCSRATRSSIPGPSSRISRWPSQGTPAARSGGEGPKVILADEPSSALDDYHSALLLAALREHCTRGGAVVVATHDPRLLEICDGLLRLAEDSLENRRSVAEH